MENGGNEWRKFLFPLNVPPGADCWLAAGNDDKKIRSILCFPPFPPVSSILLRHETEMNFPGLVPGKRNRSSSTSFHSGLVCWNMKQNGYMLGAHFKQRDWLQCMLEPRFSVWFCDGYDSLQESNIYAVEIDIVSMQFYLNFCGICKTTHKRCIFEMLFYIFDETKTINNPRCKKLNDFSS